MENHPIKKVTRSIPDWIQNILWGNAGGYCQFRGCCRPLSLHHVSKKTGNQAEKAHIYAFSKGGPRFNEEIDPEDIHSPENLLLLCRACHKEIDTNNGAIKYPVLRGI